MTNAAQEPFDPEDDWRLAPDPETDEERGADIGAAGGPVAGAGVGAVVGGPVGAMVGGPIGGGGGAIAGKLIKTDRYPR